MPLCPVSILGGLPVIAEVWFSGPDYFDEYDAGVDALYWSKKGDKPGKTLSEKIMNRLPDYWESDVLEQANDYLAMRDIDERREDKFTFKADMALPVRG